MSEPIEMLFAARPRNHVLAGSRVNQEEAICGISGEAAAMRPFAVNTAATCYTKMAIYGLKLTLTQDSSRNHNSTNPN